MKRFMKGKLLLRKSPWYALSVTLAFAGAMMFLVSQAPAHIGRKIVPICIGGGWICYSSGDYISCTTETLYIPYDSMFIYDPSILLPCNMMDF